MVKQGPPKRRSNQVETSKWCLTKEQLIVRLTTFPLSTGTDKIFVQIGAGENRKRYEVVGMHSELDVLVLQVGQEQV